MLQPEERRSVVLLRSDAFKEIKHPNRTGQVVPQVMHATKPVSIPCEVITFTLLNLYDRVGNKSVSHAHNPYRYNIQGITQRGKGKYQYRLH
jgi:hypothetical protein